jgi:hypothetical protein
MLKFIIIIIINAIAEGTTIAIITINTAGTEF